MAAVRTPRDKWIEAALRALAVGGPEAVRIEALATSLGVTKGGFYWHFADRDALLGEVLDSWEQTGVEEVIARVDGLAADERDKVRHLFRLAPQANFAVELALRDWSRRDRDVARRLRRVDERRMTWLRSLFAEFSDDDDDADARCMLAYSLLIGSWFVTARHRGRSRSEMLQLAVERLVAESWS